MKVKYFAEDGTEFDSADACKKYEVSKFQIVPIEFKDIDWKKLYDSVINDYIKPRLEGDDFDEDDSQYLFEQVIETVYGEDIFQKLNKL